MQLTASLFITTITFSVAIFGANCLECYHYRINSCSHSHCNATDRLFSSPDSPTEAAYVGMSLEDWTSMPTCSSSDEVGCSNSTITCSNITTSCAKIVFKIKTTVNTNIHEPVVDIIGSGKESEESTIEIRGCLIPDFKCQQAVGLKKEFNQSLPDSSNATTEAGSRVELITVTNEHTSCGHCDTQGCNYNMTVPTEHVMDVPSHPTPSSPTSSVAKITVSAILLIGSGIITYA